MAEQPKLITNEEFWQKRKCTKCGEYKFATGYGGETRVWECHRCPDCGNKRARDGNRRRSKDEGPERYHGAASVSKLYRQRARRFGAERKDLKQAHRTEAQYWTHIHVRYGMSKMDWLLLWHRQSGLCGICRTAVMGSSKEARKVTHVDHDHRTGKVRGLLCNLCNWDIVPLERDGWLASAMKYLGL